MKILWTGDIVGSPGRRVFSLAVREFKQAEPSSIVICNAENSAAGSGITAALAKEIFNAGADVITLGDHVWNQKDTPQLLQANNRIVRPANIPSGCPGVGITTIQTPITPITVISVLGRVFMQPAECPFLTCDKLLKTITPLSGPVFVEIHAEATSEKIALGRYLDGRVAAVAGTHTHVPTNDAQILPKGTAYITDLGMTGPIDSVIGRELDPVLHKFTSGMPARFEIAKGPAVCQGIVLDYDRQNAKIISITPFSRRDNGESLI